MPQIFLASDLGISDAERNALSAALASSDSPDPIAAEITIQTDVVSDYLAGSTISDGVFKVYVRALVLYSLYQRANKILPKGIETLWNNLPEALRTPTVDAASPSFPTQDDLDDDLELQRDDQEGT